MNCEALELPREWDKTFPKNDKVDHRLQAFFEKHLK